MADDLTERIIGAAIEVHREPGPGLLESVYREALVVELTLRGIRAVQEVPCLVIYKGHEIKGLKIDLLVEDEVILELKSRSKPTNEGVTAQLISYLKATKKRHGLIFNFDLSRLVDGIQRVSV